MPPVEFCADINLYKIEYNGLSPTRMKKFDLIIFFFILPPDIVPVVLKVHLVENVQRRDEKYWLPGQPEEAYVCVRVSLMCISSLKHRCMGFCIRISCIILCVRTFN